MSTQGLPPGPAWQIECTFHPGPTDDFDPAVATDRMQTMATHMLDTHPHREQIVLNEAGTGVVVLEVRYVIWYVDPPGVYCWYHETVYDDGRVERSPTLCGPVPPGGAITQP